MIRYTLEGLDDLGPKLRLRVDRLEARLLTVLRRIGIDLVGIIKSDKLSGQVLRNRTGRLRRSINSRVEREGSAINVRVGTNVEYARAHEFGFKGPVNVPQHLRTIKQAWGRAIGPRKVAVRAHVRNMNLPERSFMRSALAEHRPQIEAAVSAAVREAVRAQP